MYYSSRGFIKITFFSINAGPFRFLELLPSLKSDCYSYAHKWKVGTHFQNDPWKLYQMQDIEHFNKWSKKKYAWFMGSWNTRKNISNFWRWISHLFDAKISKKMQEIVILPWLFELPQIRPDQKTIKGFQFLIYFWKPCINQLWKKYLVKCRK